MAISKIKTGSITTDAITEAKVADAAIENEHLNANIITGQTELAESAAGSDVLLIYDASTGTLKKIQASNVGLQAPTISSVSPTNVLSGDGTGNATFTITGTGFTTGATASLITDGGSEVSFDSVTRDSDTQITGVIAISSLSNANEPYDVKVTLSNSLTATLTNQINIDAQPVFNTSSGSLGSNRFSMSGVEVNATDPESAGNVTFELQSGSLPPGISLTNTGANGGTATFTGTISPLASSDTVYNFTLRAVDAASNVSSRAFSFTAIGPQVESFTSSGTFSIPSGVTSVDVLVVAGGGGGSGGGFGGGGGGAGGLVYRPGFPVTPGGTVSVTVGCGGASPAVASTCGPGGSPGQDSVFGTLTAKGGGGGGHWAAVGQPGGSGGGAGRDGPQPGGATTQPIQPGDSGAYGFGFTGGGGGGPSNAGAGGGGGAGASGQNGGPTDNPITASPEAQRGYGGIGRAYTIADGTTPVYYAGGGGGSVALTPSPGGVPIGGNGGGGNGGTGNANPGFIAAQPGTANRGGGGGGQRHDSGSPNPGGSGGKGIVIVKY